MVPFYIITGWLGSGKTTLLKNILNTLSQKQKIAIIQNEFAPGGIDGTELKQTNSDFRLVEINNGSVFCVCRLKNFVQSLEKLADTYNPDVIFLESSGLADPISVAEILNAEPIKRKIRMKKIISIIDSLHFSHTFQMMPRFKHQVLVADELILNKTDLNNDKREEIISQLKKWNPFAGIIETKFCNANLEILLAENDIMGKNRRFLPVIETGSKPDMGVSFLRMHEKISREKLDEFIHEILSTSARIKGFVNISEGETIAVQSVMGQLKTQTIKNYDGRSELIIFNDTYSARELHQLFKVKAAYA